MFRLISPLVAEDEAGARIHFPSPRTVAYAVGDRSVILPREPRFFSEGLLGDEVLLRDDLNWLRLDNSEDPVSESEREQLVSGLREAYSLFDSKLVITR